MKRKLMLMLVLLSGLAITLKLTHWYQLEVGESRIEQVSARQLDELVSFLGAALARYENIPQVLASNPVLAETLMASKDDGRVQALNLYLEDIKKVTDSADIYLIDAKGIAIAASNWAHDFTFIGQDYSFRPYHSQAISGVPGSYYAVGTLSDKRGFYFSYPVYQHSAILGTIVVKIDITQIEQQAAGLASAGKYEYLISGADDIIFLSSTNEWRLSSLSPLTQAKQIALNTSKRYASRVLSELLIDPPFRNLPDMEAATYRISKGIGHERYLEIHQQMTQAGWRVHLLAPLQPLYDRLPVTLLLASCLYLLLALGILFSLDRRRNLRRMQLAQEQLERRVKARTQALEDTNHKLKGTQDELIQAAKLTLIGTLSASINHELTQPLAALRNYAQNTQTLLVRNMPEQAKENLRIMTELTDRLADIVGQFKHFNHKSEGNDCAIDVSLCIEQALTIVQPEIDKQGVNLSLQLPEKHYEVWGDRVRLQQVLVYIISNAILAMQQSKVRQLTIGVMEDGKLYIVISDSGPAMREGEPHFSTNERQGLGLSISQRIIESMQGKISVANAAQGGTIFTLQLPIYFSEGRPSDTQEITA